MMKFRTSTERMRLLIPGLYGTTLGSFFEDCTNEYIDEFKQEVVNKGMEYINDILSQELVGIKAVATNGSLNQPRWYNFHNDEIEFDLEVDDKVVELINSPSLLDNKLFWKWCRKEYGSSDGFISFMPYYKDKWIELAQGKDVESCVEMYIMWLLADNDLSNYQRDFEDDVIEKGNQNGWYVIEDDEN